MDIQQTERQRYQEVWESLSKYGDYSPGEQAVPIFKTLVIPGSTVLDLGAGSGKGALALDAAGFHVTLADLTDEGLVEDAQNFPFEFVCVWNSLGRPRGVDYVYCVDVMEHIPTQFTMLAIFWMLEHARLGVFLSIAFRIDDFGSWVGKGKPLHQTVQPFSWWRDSLREVAEVVEARDLIERGVFFIRRQS